MSDLSFSIKTSKDFFEKLKDDHQEFCKDKTSSRVALNCALASWHLSEWVYNEFNSKLVSDFPSLVDFQRYIKERCPSLQIMHDIANGTKHYLLSRHRPIIKETNLHQGEFSSDFSRDFNISTLNIDLNDGTKKYFEDEIEQSILFWSSYLKLTD